VCVCVCVHAHLIGAGHAVLGTQGEPSIEREVNAQVHEASRPVPPGCCCLVSPCILLLFRHRVQVIRADTYAACEGRQLAQLATTGSVGPGAQGQ